MQSNRTEKQSQKLSALGKTENQDDFSNNQSNHKEQMKCLAINNRH